jgi:hypothetical protein
MRFRFFSLLFALLPALLRAQSVHWDPASGSLPVGQATALRLVFEECAPKVQPEIPKVADLTFQYVGPTSNTSIINGTISSSEILTFAVALTKDHSVTIPVFTVETNKGTFRVPAARFDAASATVGRSGTPLTDATSARLTVTPNSVWAGQVFEIAATIEAARSYYPQFNRGFEWTPDPLIAEAWSEPQQSEFVRGGEPRAEVNYHTRAIARSPGRFNLNAATHIVNLSVGISGFGFFQQRQYDQYSITSNTPTLEIKALPTPPVGFSGAVGQFKLTSKVVPEKASVGEPVTWTLELTGSGNWPDIDGLPSRDVSNDFQVVQPKAKRTPAEGKVFDAALSEDVVLVPTKGGSYALGPINFIYFDPTSGSYKTLTAPRTVVTISAPSTPQTPNPQQPNSSSTEPPPPAETSRTVTPPAKPALPAGIPRDPLPGSDEVSLPMPTSKLLVFVAAPFAALVVFWSWLALREAQRTDPVRPRRDARARLAATLAEMKNSPPSALSAQLLRWQHDTARLWQISHAAPRATALEDTVWAQLWAEADRALYGAQNTLPPDWIARAEAALAAKRVPGFQPLRLFLPQNLFPFAAVLALSLLVPLSLLRAAESGESAYRRGDFAAAEKSWRDVVAQHPTDWIARHNLSLALAQQDRASEAAAQAAAAFVQNPAHPAVEWHFAFTAEKSGFAPSALAAFLSGGPLPAIARHASPTDWQRSLIVAAFLIALALGGLLANAYGRRTALLRWSSLIVLALSVLLAGSATAGVLAYGVAGDARAVIIARTGVLRSVPTEVDTTQKTTPLAAGSIAITDKAFLGWVRLAFENGQTGWVRKEEVVGLWR